MHVFHSKQYKKSLTKVLLTGKVKITEIDVVVDLIAQNQRLPVALRDHALRGDYFGFRECHIKPDLLLVYKIEKKVLILILADIGSHSELFG